MKRKIWEKQAERQKNYPADRIAFTPSAASFDCITFQKYKENRITLSQACKEIAANNFLESVTVEQFLNEYRICGYANTIAVRTAEADIKEYAKRRAEQCD